MAVLQLALPWCACLLDALACLMRLLPALHLYSRLA
jgi:hypothetical protein